MKRLFIILFPILMLLFSQTAFTQAETNASPQLVVHLLDYLAKDYGGAVQNGKIISESEYSEQVEFSEIVGKNSDTFPALKSDGAFMTGIRQLQSLIKSKGSAEEVAALARKLQQQAILLAKIDVAPSTIPDLQSGASLYQANCVACHGATGHGDGAAGATLDPKPANFHDPELVLNSAPYKFYNTIRLGVPGTGMASFSNLSDKEVWALAFYIKSLAHKNDLSVELPKIDLKEAAVLTDKELIERVGGSHEQAKITVGSLRAQGFSAASEGPLDIAQSLLNKSIEAAENNNFALAKEFGLRAYLEGIEPLEPKMKANIPGFVEEIEALMSGYRSMLEKNESISKLKAQRAEIFGKLNEVKKIFSESKMSPSVAFGAAFSIFLREGFEAILIIIILISILRAMNQPDAIKWVHCGWISAVALGVAAWFASGLLLQMSGLSRELLEGAISLLAVIVLVYVGFWLHRYSEMRKWRVFLESKLKHGLTKGSYLVLSIVAFMAVFREAFEVVLFLRAIWIDLDSSGQTVAGAGVLSSLLVLVILSYFAIKESKKLPLGLLFQICSWTMMILAVILIGKGLHSLQEAGMIGVSVIGIPLRVDVLGIYPSIQTLAAQVGLIILFMTLLIKDRNGEH